MKITLNFEFNTSCTGYNEKYDEFYYNTEDYQYTLNKEKSLKLIIRFIKEYYSLSQQQAEWIADDFAEEIYDQFCEDIDEMGENIYYDEAYDEWRNSKFDY